MSQSSMSLRGVFPPITTPFDPAGEVDYAALAANIRRWNGFDLAGYVVLGSNGECAYLNEAEKLRCVETVRQETPNGKLVIAGTGCESTRETIALTQRAAHAGADAALVITPHFFGAQMTGESLVQHYRMVADASPIPVILYNVPKFTGVDIEAGTVERAAGHPNIIGLKDSGGNITKLGDIVRLTGPTFQVLAGSAGFFFASLTLGAAGGVLALANIAPQECIDIYRSWEAGRWAEAAELQRRMIPVNGAVTARFGVAGLKVALDLLGYAGGPVRSPLLGLGERERQALRQILSSGGVLPA